MADDDVSESLPALEESQAAMEEQWRTLTAACVDKMQGRSVDDLELPDVETQDVEDILLEQVLSLLSKPAVSAVDCSAMFTALTGTVDLRRHRVDGYRMSAMVCDLQAQGDIFLGGAACVDVTDLPTSKDELASFLSGPSAKLFWDYTKLLLEYQADIKEQVRKKRSASITEPKSPLWQAEAQEDDEQSEARTPLQTPKLYGLGQVTVLTPKNS
ncbi:hypothetical protein KI688_000934 [Linnemannia hyalina]|uniref:Uncharacterized protein n=1 Tax=Linnemannia hyalina TaxID=64524 RepID=A0A9P7Y6I8_9FUNG|nr:hypothetical protein KI688_000934 [Linnemannia hyalina]